MRRTFLDADLVEWQAYVTGGQPQTSLAARIFFVCPANPFERPRWVAHESGDVAAAERDLQEMGKGMLVELLAGAQPLA